MTSMSRNVIASLQMAATKCVFHNNIDVKLLAEELKLLLKRTLF